MNFSDLGLQLTRSARAFKLWLSLRTSASTRSAPRSTARSTSPSSPQRRIEASDALELAAPPSLGIVCFRRRRRRPTTRSGARTALVAALEQSGLGFISSTRVHGRTALRLCVLNHTTRAEDVERVLDVPRDRGAAPSDATVRAARSSVPTAVPALRPARRRSRRARSLRSRPSAECRPARRSSSQWDTSRDFFVIEEGLVDVLFDDELVATLRPGDYFGEIAALEWGARLRAFARIATVVARDDCAPPRARAGGAAQLLAEFPRLESEIRHTAHRRMRETL